MPTSPNLIVMLTRNDQTAQNAHQIFLSCKDTKAKIWGFKDTGLPLPKMQRLFDDMKSHGKATALEVVAYTQEEGLRAAKIAAQCGCDFLMGTCYFDSIHDFCQEHSVRYMPFVGEVCGRPSVLSGGIEQMVAQAQSYLDKGVFGIDLLGYRYCGDATVLNSTIVSRIKAPVCIAGSINSFDRLAAVRKLKPWAFTVGGAFFENKFGTSFAEQIDRVVTYMEKDSES